MGVERQKKWRCKAWKDKKSEGIKNALEKEAVLLRLRSTLKDGESIKRKENYWTNLGMKSEAQERGKIKGVGLKKKKICGKIRVEKVVEG